MADNTLHLTNTPGASYGTRPNVKYPGNQTNATAVATAAITRINDRLPSGVTIAGLAITSDGEA